MKFRSETTIPHPREKVFEIYRDRLGDTVAFLDDITAVNVLKREEDGSVTKLHNEWVGDVDIPAAAAGMIKPEHLRWDDYASWDATSTSCTYDIKTRFFRDAVSCTGSTTLVEDPRGTRVVVEGDLVIDPKGIKGMPSFLAKRIIPQIEKFIVTILPRNLEKTAEAVGRFLDTQD